MSFFIIAMLISCGIMAYKKVEKRVVIVFTILSYGIFVFAKDMFSNDELIFWYLLTLVCLTLFLYKKYGSQCLGIIFFALPWVTLTRMLGFPDNPDFWEKGLGVYFISGICGTFSLWLLFLKYHQKLYQKILFWILSVYSVFIFSLFSEIKWEMILPAHIIEILFYIQIPLAFIFCYIVYIFFYLGEVLLLFFLCYEIFFKASTSPIPKES